MKHGIFLFLYTHYRQKTDRNPTVNKTRGGLTKMFKLARSENNRQLFKY